MRFRQSIFFSNYGNWGDGVIRYGTLKFFRDINLDNKELKYSQRHWLLPFRRGDTIIYSGSGAWCKLYSHAMHNVTKLARRFNVIVLPFTYELQCSIPNTTFFCRDLFESKQNMPDAIFCHDMAFFLGNHFTPKKGSGKGYFFRGDEESAKRLVIPPNNNDLSVKSSYLSDVAPFFDEINKFAVIYTDRLHISIAACLLEKEVHLYPNSYFKNQAVYLSSMKDYFDNVYFHKDFDF